jgi:hypothetical protein
MWWRQTYYMGNEIESQSLRKTSQLHLTWYERVNPNST